MIAFRVTVNAVGLCQSVKRIVKLVGVPHFGTIGGTLEWVGQLLRMY